MLTSHCELHSLFSWHSERRGRSICVTDKCVLLWFTAVRVSMASWSFNRPACLVEIWIWILDIWNYISISENVNSRYLQDADALVMQHLIHGSFVKELKYCSSYLVWQCVVTTTVCSYYDFYAVLPLCVFTSPVRWWAFWNCVVWATISILTCVELTAIKNILVCTHAAFLMSAKLLILMREVYFWIKLFTGHGEPKLSLKNSHTAIEIKIIHTSKYTLLVWESHTADIIFLPLSQ